MKRSVLMAVISVVGMCLGVSNAGADTAPRSIDSALRSGELVNVQMTKQSRPADLPAEQVQAATAGEAVVCFKGHMQDIGWATNWDCDNDGNWAFAGTRGEQRRLEDVRVWAANTGGRTCVQAHMQDYGWQVGICIPDEQAADFGIAGRSLRMEAFRFGHTTRGHCLNGHVQDVGDQVKPCQGAGTMTEVGTTGQSRRLEQISATINT